VREQILREFAGLYDELSDKAGLTIHLFEHSDLMGTPDACFPNNWFSTHAAGEGRDEATLVTYPMAVPNRRGERRPDILSRFEGRYPRHCDLTGHEAGDDARFLEGTGVLVLDRVRGIAYANLSGRCDEALAQHWVDQLGYRELVAFRAAEEGGAPVYHTNVMMCVGTSVAIVCSESVTDAQERQHLLAKLSEHHEVVDISRAQMGKFCGNVLEVLDKRGLPGLVMSSQAFHAFTEDQRKVILRHVGRIYHAPIDTLEYQGGGGVRCCLAEVF